jgi:hypothetical protein
MKTMTIQYDDGIPFALGESPVDFEKEAKFLLFAKLYEQGRISAGKAAELCGIGKPGFLWKAGEIGILAARLDEDQLPSEFQNA